MKTIQISLITLAGLFVYACGGGGDTTQTETTTENEGAEISETSYDDNQDSDGNDDAIRRYPIKSGIIEYKVSGLQTGTETIYFDDWGMKEAKYTKTEMKIAGTSQEEDRVTYIDGAWNYTYDAIQKSGTKLKNPLFEVAKHMKEKGLKALGEKMMKDMGGEKVGQEEILGKDCEVWEVKNMKTKIWIWNNIPFKTESNLMQTITVEATSFEENASIPTDKLSPPKDVEFQDISKMMKDIPVIDDDN